MMISSSVFYSSCNKEENTKEYLKSSNTAMISPSGPIVNGKPGIYAGDPLDPNENFSNVICKGKQGVCAIEIIDKKQILENNYPILDFSGYSSPLDVAHVVEIHHNNVIYPIIGSIIATTTYTDENGEDYEEHNLNLQPWVE
jgi:hypothetical protein